VKSDLYTLPSLVCQIFLCIGKYLIEALVLFPDPFISLRLPGPLDETQNRMPDIFCVLQVLNMSHFECFIFEACFIPAYGLSQSCLQSSEVAVAGLRNHYSWLLCGYR
jgi:hypothetical protein